MNYSVIVNKLKEKLEEISESMTDDSIIVLKGIPFSFIGQNISVSYDDIIKNKLGYLFALFNSKRKFILYEEFLLLSDFIKQQYKQIFIINNNLYMELYPINDYFSGEIKNGLLTHFTESDDNENDDAYIGNINEYIPIFNGLKVVENDLIGSYYAPDLSNEKIRIVNIFDDNSLDVISVSDENSVEIDLVEESDYVKLVRRIYEEPREICIRISNYTGDKRRLKDHISQLAYFWKNSTNIVYAQIHSYSEDFVPRVEFKTILKKYWGYDSYRDLPVYDMAKLDKGEKSVIKVSQERIISNIVEQVENCGNHKSFRDIFVTAPTGAGKSVMFQVPAIHLAETYGLLTIVISPLIGLMNDQVKNLELKNYTCAETINSDISPIIKQNIINKVSEGKSHILYISPETLLSRSDVEQLIGDRTIGMIVIDEAHIVTTWGKQFRPDYWYLGDHIRKLRKRQIDKKQRSFVIATFTATAIYHGLEDMYTETINSLYMLSPITYLGYIKRNDVNIIIDRTKTPKEQRTEYELDKIEEIATRILPQALITGKKTLIYFPTVALINRCFEYLEINHLVNNVAVYHGSLPKSEKQENYEDFYSGKKLVMLATKAFGMGIDINDIERVVHVAPTGNVCDYVQEIGRAARKENLMGEAFYHYNNRDFKFINRFHGMSTIHPYQLIKVIKKIGELYQQTIDSRRGGVTKKRNAMLLDSENFSYIFSSPLCDETESINKVKTALLLIQKDFESKFSFSPISVRPIPLFSVGFFEVDPAVQNRISTRYYDSIEEIEPSRHICRVQLDAIWKNNYREHSFPKFKYMLYTGDEELDLVTKYPMRPALCVSINFEDDYRSIYENILWALKSIINNNIASSTYIYFSDIVKELRQKCKSLSEYKARTISEVIIASIDSYRKEFTKTHASIVKEKTTIDAKRSYQFNPAINGFFEWVEKGFNKIEKEAKRGKLYLVNDIGNTIKEYSIILGILESIECLTFEMLGGANSQLYIYINQMQTLKNIISAPYKYSNRLLEMVSERHTLSVKMLTYIYGNEFDSAAIWDLIEDYFLGQIPDKVKDECRKEIPKMNFD